MFVTVRLRSGRCAFKSPQIEDFCPEGFSLLSGRLWSEELLSMSDDGYSDTIGLARIEGFCPESLLYERAYDPQSKWPIFIFDLDRQSLLIISCAHFLVEFS